MHDWHWALNTFFDELRLYEDEQNGKSGRESIRKAAINFLGNTDKEERALEVYRNFFEAYWMGVNEEENPFLQLVKKLKEYEMTSGRLVNNHRDHFEHVVNVFLLGLAIYAVQPDIQSAFKKYCIQSEYKNAYTLPHEEFFYRWGLASLLHDIAYPIELTLKQAQAYMELLTSSVCTGNVDTKIFIDIPGLLALHEVPVLHPLPQYEEKFNSEYPYWNEQPYKGSADRLLADYLAKVFSLPCDDVWSEVEKKKEDMSQRGFVDHAYYSAVTLIKWCHCLAQKGQWHPAYFYYPILDAASAIMLHNWYKYGLQKKPFSLGPLSGKTHPIAFLLILCDEIQEWGRPGFRNNGEVYIPVKNAAITLGKGYFDISYFIESEVDAKKIENKEAAIMKLINVKNVFSQHFSVSIK